MQFLFIVLSNSILCVINSKKSKKTKKKKKLTNSITAINHSARVAY